MNEIELRSELENYAKVNNGKAVFQLISTIIPYFTITTLMYWLLIHNYSYWWVLLLGIINAGFLARTFIIFHDCVHYSFFRSELLCRFIGHFCGIIAFTPFTQWQRAHQMHHETSSNLDRRGMGDMWMITAKEYFSSTRMKKLWYRLYRNPIFLFIIASVIKFVLLNRLPKNLKWNMELISDITTTGALVLIIALAWNTIGIRNYIYIQLPIIWAAASLGLWLFYIQHQFKNAYWARNKDYDAYKACREGASFYKLPGLLRWFTGNIGYHHVHHLHPGIPNYNLKHCYEETDELKKANTLTLISSLRCMFLKVYDEDTKEMVSFRKARFLAKARKC